MLLKVCIFTFCASTAAPVRLRGVMSEEGDIDVESAEDVPDIAVEATATTAEDKSDIYSPTVSFCSMLPVLTLYVT